MKIENCPVFHNGIKIRKKQKLRKLGKKINIAFAANLENENNPIFFLDICTMILKKRKNIVFNVFSIPISNTVHHAYDCKYNIDIL